MHLMHICIFNIIDMIRLYIYDHLVSAGLFLWFFFASHKRWHCHLAFFLSPDQETFGVFGKVYRKQPTTSDGEKKTGPFQASLMPENEPNDSKRKQKHGKPGKLLLFETEIGQVRSATISKIITSWFPDGFINPMTDTRILKSVHVLIFV